MKNLSTSNLDQLLDILQSPNLLILTLGNSLRGDDGVGVIIAEELQYRLPKQRIINAQTVPANYLGKIVEFNPTCILVIDAIDAGLAPGDLLVFSENEIMDVNSTSAHYQEFSKLSKYLSFELEKSPTIWFVGIQIMSSDLMASLSTKVNESKDSLLDFLVLQLNS